MSGTRCTSCKRYSCICDDQHETATGFEMFAAAMLLIGVASVLQAAWRCALVALLGVVIYLIWCAMTGRDAREEAEDIYDSIQARRAK